MNFHPQHVMLVGCSVWSLWQLWQVTMTVWAAGWHRDRCPWPGTGTRCPIPPLPSCG